MDAITALQIAGTIALLAIAALVIYVLVSLLPKVKNTLQSLQKFVDNDVKKLLAEVNSTVTKLNEEEMPKIDGIITNVNTITGGVQELSEKQITPIMENVNAITKSVQELSETEIKPIASNVQELTTKINEDVAKITETVTTATEFSNDTIHKAEFYRDKLFTPVIEIVSFWNALKAGFTSLSGATKKGKKEKEDKGGEE